MPKVTEHIMLEDSLPMAMPLVLSFLDSSRVVHQAILDREGGIRFVNQALSKILKVDCAEVTGK